MNLRQRWLVAVLALAILVLPTHFWHQVRSANLTSVSITLSTPRLSFAGILAAGNTVGSSMVTLNSTAGAAAATSAANLFEGDTVLIGSSQYRVASPSAGNTFTITGLTSTPAVNTLQSGDADTGDRVIASRSAALTIRFTTATAIANGSFRVLIPAASSNANDALPDQTGWDYGGGAAGNVTVTCPNDVNGGGHQYDFVTGRATPSAIVRNGRVYHAFECAYSGTGGNGSAFNGTTYGTMVISQRLINPAPAANHAEGFADTYAIIVEQLSGFTSGYAIVDSTAASVAVIESVRVTAVVSPQITFRILGVNSTQLRCGATTSVTTTPTLVPLGELLIDSFKYAAQQLVVSTNATNGYSVTAIAGNQLHRTGQACTNDATTGGCIPDSTGDNSNMTHATPDKWTLTATKGFGYSLEDNTVGTADMEFYHNENTGAGGCDGSAGNCYRQFADNEAGQSPVSIFGSATTADNDNLYVCYKAVVGVSQEAGSDYATDITYRATATF